MLEADQGEGPMREPVLLLACAGITACGGGESSSASSPLTEAERDDVCGEYCDHQVSCGLPFEEICLNWCGELASVLRADAARALVACSVAIECGDAGQGRCLAEVTNATEASAAYQQARDECTKGAVRCGVWYGCDLTYFVLLSDPTLGELGSCFALECGGVDGCLDGVLGL